MKKTARIQEIFTSIQGEGVFSGKRQIFVRFFGCNLNCAFCDTVQPPEDFKEYSAEDLFFAVSGQAEPQNVHSVSLTGGEPLLETEFLKNILPKLKQSTYCLYLETNGTMPQQLESIIDYVDIVAMDIKLPSSTGLGSFWKEHAEFLKIAMRKMVFAKVVITAKTTAKDFYRAVNLIREKDPHIALVIQPVNPQLGTEPADAKILEQFKNIASEHLYKVRIIPQMHKLFGVK